MRETTLVWFRLDLRLCDNPALLAAVERGGPVVPVFIWAPEEEAPWPPGTASRWWLGRSLARLDAALRQRGSRLILRRGPTLQTLQHLLEESGATAVYWNRRYEPAVIRRDDELETMLRQQGCVTQSFNASLLFEPWEVGTRQGRPYRVFSAFWKACRAQPAPESPRPAPPGLRRPPRWPGTLSVAELDLCPRGTPVGGLQPGWRPGEAAALDAIENFLDGGLSQYATARDLPDRRGTSCLSPHLHFGEIGPRQLWWAVAGRRRGRWAADLYLRELGWREFASHLLFHFPHTPERPFRERPAGFPARRDRARLRAWQRGQTGYPIVDAGMRQLRETGWMNNRVRMIAASFLVKDLWVPWQQGAAWFWDRLVDADLANNTLNWQWIAGCGADAAPSFRFFNPVRQGEKFDPHGSYVRRWLPRLGKLSGTWIHQPWMAPAPELAKAGVTLGRDYPGPLVDHQQARAQAFEALRELRHETARR